jgi:large subunit ribosomal protein L24
MAKPHSAQPRKQRRAAFNASAFERHRQLSVALSRDLRRRYKRRALPLRKGDTVRVISGSFKGREERVSKVDVRSLRVTLDGVTIKKVDQKLKPLPIRSNHLILTRLNLGDPWRRKVLNVSAAEVPPEEAPAGEAETTSAPSTPETEETSTQGEMEGSTAEETEPEAAEPDDDAPPVPSPKKRKAKPAPKEDE